MGLGCIESDMTTKNTTDGEGVRVRREIVCSRKAVGTG